MANPVEITKNVGRSEDVRHGKTTITANTATQISAKVVGLSHGVLLRCPGASDPAANTQPVWVGGSKVTTATGFPILPGETLQVDVDDLSKLYGTSNVAAQVVQYIGV